VKDSFQIVLAKLAEKQFQKVPSFIQKSLKVWMKSVVKKGLNETRKTPGYHDEPLKGNRTGQRSIRLSRSYRAIYEEHPNGSITLIVILEVNKHDY
jgi:proteic killer suppression protein